MNAPEKPLLVLLGQMLPNRIAGFTRLAEAMPIEVVDLANDVPHGGGLVPLPDSIPQRKAGLREITALIGSGRYRAVMIETQEPASFSLATLTAHRKGVPLIVWLGLQEIPRTLRWQVGRRILRQALRWSDSVITYGAAQTRLAHSLGARRVVDSVDWVDLDFWTAQAPSRHEGGLRFLFAGRRDPEKGPGVLLDAWEKSGLAHTGATLRMVGGGGWRPRGALPAGVTIEGGTDRNALREIYAESDVLVVPSITTRTFKEPWGIVVAEAMCQQVTVITSDSVGAVAGGLAVDGDTALVVPERDPSALATAMERLASDRDLRERLAEAGRKRVERFGPEVWVEDVESAVELAVG
jgi:glycosyltransferase involved in cell wall biosynthesis